MIKLHLIRHGQTDYNIERRIQGQRDSHLTDTGIKQALALKEKLDSINFDVVYSSSNIRAVDTAKILMADKSQNITFLDELKEIYLGHWEGRLNAEIEQTESEQFNNFWNHPDQFYCPGSETFNDLQQRALNVFTKITEKHRDQVILIVSHGAFLRALLVYFAKRPLNDLWKPPHLHNCAHSIVHKIEPGQFKIVMYADKTRW